ncbi:hypothetical protein RJ639_015714 [Escallonia herrerae]|uniref:Bromo domain-containing protein n=1 Tax=Escallonia herrerae TaxID=1293975 RepID=A0AA89ALJ3_9ASTE|nr:hypothetical protein RJ639_015714 [Escallonia herrerae]
MGKVAATTAAAPVGDMKKKKKKGRPSLLDLQKRAVEKQQQEEQERQRRERQRDVISRSPSLSSPAHRSTRRDANSGYPGPELTAGEDDDDERKEKKVKLVVRLPQSNQHYPTPLNPPRSSSANSLSCGSDSNENQEAAPKKRKINAGSADAGADQDEKVSKAMDTLHGSPMESGPTTTPLPDKKLLVFILDRLQKKDTYGVFSEPVDPNELPDYHEIIEHPMDFGTLRRKLDEGLYANLEELEADVFLICSNAMEYNSSDTIYFRQARSIQELAKRDFENLRQEGDDGELQPKVVRRGRPPSKHLKKPLGRPPVERVTPELSSGATLASGEDNTTGSNGYNLRRNPALYRFHSTDALVNSHRSRNGENYSEWLSDWNDEFPGWGLLTVIFGFELEICLHCYILRPFFALLIFFEEWSAAHILKADMKYGKKHFSIDETRRDTYKQFHPSAHGHETSGLLNFGGDVKQLTAVGLQFEHGYARSLARFATNLGPFVWKIASKKFESFLPAGVKFGPGLLGETEASGQRSPFLIEKQRSASHLTCETNPSRPVPPPTSGVNSAATCRSSLPPNEELLLEANRSSTSLSEFAVLDSSISGIRPGSSFQAPYKPVYQPDRRNGFSAEFGYNLPSQTGMVRVATPVGPSGLEGASGSSQMLGMLPKSDSTSSHSAPEHHIDTVDRKPKLESSSKLHSGDSLAPEDGPDSGKVAEMEHSGGKTSWQVLPPSHRQYSLPAPPDLNVMVQGPNSPSSGLRIGSPQQPDLALQL